MARISGGIFSRPRGSVSDVVFGAARTRTGKVVTAREKVPPSNPNTPAQQTVRNKFKDALQIVKAIGPSIYVTDFNRAVSQLPGWQSLMSIFTRKLDASFTLLEPDDVQLGTLHFPVTFTIATGAGPGEIVLTWSGEFGPNGTAADVLQVIAIPALAANRVTTDAVLANDTRNGSPLTITGLVDGASYQVGVYFRGAGTAAGELSLLKWSTVSA
jgi:hypothetical protein